MPKHVCRADAAATEAPESRMLVPTKLHHKRKYKLAAAAVSKTDNSCWQAEASSTFGTVIEVKHAIPKLTLNLDVFEQNTAQT